MSVQIPLNIRLPRSVSLRQFIPGNNVELMAQLQAILKDGSEQFLYLWGREGVGKSHLLQAACQHLSEQGLSTVYISLKDIAELSPEMLEGLEHTKLICIDDLQRIAGMQDWEQAVFHLLNRVKSSSTPMLMAANNAPDNIGIQLKDMQSRLYWAVLYRVNELQDQDKIIALSRYAASLGMNMSPEVGEYLIRHFERNMSSLIHQIDQFDVATLSQQRKLTIPFVREQLTNVTGK